MLEILINRLVEFALVAYVYVMWVLVLMTAAAIITAIFYKGEPK